jgi:cysteine desulfurase / selenocysteine lyase
LFPADPYRPRRFLTCLGSITNTVRIADQLGEAGINVSVSISDYARWDLEPRGLDAVVRASVHYYNTHDELGRLCEALPEPAAAP